MMRRRSVLFPLIVFVLILSSCHRGLEPDSSFVGGSQVQLKVAGSVIHTYDPLTGQLGYNSTKKEFRVGDDQMRNYYTVTCSSIPSSVGQKLDATVTWTIENSTKSVKGRFEVAKADKDRYWLWCGDKKIQTGVTVCILR